MPTFWAGKQAEGSYLFLDPMSFDIISGTPARGALGRYSAWVFDATLAEQVQGNFCLPPDWNSMTARLAWASDGSAGGNARWSLGIGHTQVGGDVAATAATSNLTVATGGQNRLKFDEFPDVIQTPPNSISAIRITRYGAYAEDTLVNDTAFIGLLLTRNS